MPKKWVVREYYGDYTPPAQPGQPAQASGNKWTIRETYGDNPIVSHPQVPSSVPQYKEPLTWAKIRDPFTGELRETEQTKNLPEMTPLTASKYTEGAKDTAQALAGNLLSADDEGRKNIIKKLVPNALIETDEKGNDFVTFPDGKKYVMNRPGFSASDAYQLAFDTALFIPGGIAAKPIKGAIKKGIVGAIGAGLTETGRQQVGQELGTEEPTNIGRIALTAGMGGFAEAIPAVVQARKLKAAQKRIGIAESQQELATELGKSAKRSDVLTGKTGIELGRAQKTRGISDAKRMNYVAQLPAAEQKAMKFLERQNKQSYAAVANLMDTIAPAETVGKASRRTREAARGIISDAEKVRLTKSKPYYSKAFQDKNVYSPDSTIAKIDERLSKLPKGGKRAEALNKVKGFLKTKGDDVDAEEIFIHETNSSIPPIIAEESSVGRDFGGIFATKNGNTGIGKYKHRYKIDGDIANYRDVKNIIDENDDFIKKELYEDITEDQLELLKKNITEETAPNDDIFSALNAEDEWDAFHKVQKLRGAVAKKEGFAGVTIEDEFDDSVLLFPGKAKPVKKAGLGIEQLDEVKVEIDDMIDAAKRKGQNKLVGNLVSVKKTLLKEVDELNPDYKKARAIYSKYSPQIEELKESTIGSIAGKKDTQIKTVARELFEPDKNLFDPAAVRKAKSLIEAKDPEAWNGIVRAEWQRRLGKARIDPMDLAANENVPAKLRSKIFGSGKEREALYYAMSQEQKKTARYLEEALKRAEKGRPAGSPTAVNQVFEKELRGAGGVLRGLFSRTRETISELGQDAVYDMRVKALADIMFDPKWTARAADLRKLSPTSIKSEKMFVNMLRQAIKQGKKGIKPAIVSQSPEAPEAVGKIKEIIQGN